MDFTLAPIRPARLDWQAGTPFARDYGDSYFMPGRGREESRVVFIEGNGLPARFAALPSEAAFIIGETGFGTGLNCLLAAQCFLEHAPHDATLQLYSAERHPLTRQDLATALALWPELGALGKALLEAWPPPAPGFHRIRLAPRVELTLMFGDAALLWPQGPKRVDAWFLDGFAPARNPQLWTAELLGTLARHSCPGATAATFTAAGQVRRDLDEAGFQVERRPGFGGKRHRLVAQMPGEWRPRRRRRGSALVVGAGLAGATTARALAERGWQVRVLDPALSAPAPAALNAVLYATASHHLNAQNRFYLGAFLHAQRWLERLGFPRNEDDGRLEGVIQHLVDPRVARKTCRAVDSGTWPREMLAPLGEALVRFEGAGYLRPGNWCRFLLDHPDISTTVARASSISRDLPVGVVLGSGDRLEADAVVVCTAGATDQFDGMNWLPLRTVRGQVTFCRATKASLQWREAHCHTGYVTPAFEGVHCIGATFDRQRQSAVVDPVDDQHNLAELERNVPALWQGLGGSRIEVVGQHAGLRCQSGDWLPLVGPLPDPSTNPHTLNERVWLNVAHGSRGLTHTPLCADLIADQLSGHPVATDTGVVASLAPERFIERRRRREPGWRP
ncbi:bifunctional tRNA (5-methylaminomethyl-2-thiouridine)(34)-methyltransferase MnmD/FAD-dependent 5-carboxymethylaminomethyl-2-thiouridine(34) oxidoreductase MnmC [Wenzhouxiangella sp. XN201]|uniref:bifunctional tRNA (5-methylaminomethyl-2-thiouridine)(34)-methyltransferase MnmD/FAD-dependent 5-carboxymethylaminomethyl-2-thiouridine(34) oxidoreductase MnmC n=1 Tax=Wenzhouxiangella sp. XN201 TaxID=2710755 RepID=UPI0013C9F4B6|nr:bifunctional tRNA (5-methylaminomethyl-2-thiouridine)(34)-methyltransferase MnmD/FAD-dependent 5-carboxymethylaminomethyl-2-thiouridine(34) oxidoreductase MnmC [Wenzhouxiangella sp. XN201]NEZ02848.1 bifunctional tRNA (5-methylaminomethyl-2-thiouridine)(34)-methyltransferase MnmD/FAD-dependent 5-carboxymethylaminomethyl-2-thiouridine(34) oxidoreductase MnmC [Wenzhouxiangella sp. XN201]